MSVILNLDPADEVKLMQLAVAAGFTPSQLARQLVEAGIRNRAAWHHALRPSDLSVEEKLRILDQVCAVALDLPNGDDVDVDFGRDGAEE